MSILVYCFQNIKMSVLLSLASDGLREWVVSINIVEVSRRQWALGNLQ